MNGCAAAIIFRCAMYWMLRLPRYALNAQSNTSRCSGFRPLATVLPSSSTSSIVSNFSMCAMMFLISLGVVAEALQRFGHGAIDDLQHAAAREEFVFHQRDVGFDAGRVAIHEERDGAGRGEHGDLRIAVAVLLCLVRGRDPSRCELRL